ncbi:MAG: TolB family protein, partial [Planctomycetaceae bacterium]
MTSLNDRRSFATPVALALCWITSHQPSLQAEDLPPDRFRPAAVETTGVPHVPPELPERLRQYQAVRNATFRGWYPDGGGILIATRFAETNQLHRVTEPGGRREQLTFQTEPVNGRPIPGTTNGSLILTLSQGGNENDQVLHFDPTEGKARLLTDGKSRNSGGAWSNKGDRIVYTSTRRNRKDADFYLVSPADPRTNKLLSQVNEPGWAALD